MYNNASWYAGNTEKTPQKPQHDFDKTSVISYHSLLEIILKSKIPDLYYTIFKFLTYSNSMANIPSKAWLQRYQLYSRIYKN